MKKSQFTSISCYFPLLALLSSAWIFYYTHSSDSMGIWSYLLQTLAVFSLLQVAEIRTTGKRFHYALAGTGMVWVFLVHLNAFILSVTSMSLYESLVVLATGGDFINTLDEAGLSAAYIPLLALLLALVFCSGMALYILMRRSGVMIPWSARANTVVLSISLQLFVAEQFYSREAPGFFWRRSIPMYIELLSENSGSLTLALPRRETGTGMYSNTARASNPKNVIYIILESFRSDSVNDELAPGMAALSLESFTAPLYYTDAIYTSLAWNTLLMDRPPYTFEYDMEKDREEMNGSPLFRVFRNAGYETYAAFSGNMEWKNFHERANGKEGLINHYWCGFGGGGSDRNLTDNGNAEQVVSWIRGRDAKSPFFMVVQLDSTHWTYYADSDLETYTPQAGKNINMATLNNAAGIELLRNRYKNSVRQVDRCVSRITACLKERGIYEETAIVIVSDHGEGFAPGMIGHSVFHDDITRPAFMMRLPGSGRREIAGFFSHKDILPALMSYLGIRAASMPVDGREISGEPAERGMLVFHGSLLMAQLIFKDYSVLFRVKRNGGSITFTPVWAGDDKGRILELHDKGLWREAITGIIGSSRWNYSVDNPAKVIL